MESFASGSQGQSKKLPVPSVKSMASQLLLALDFLHREYCIIHTGIDIKPDNLLIKMNNTNQVLGPGVERSSPSGKDKASPVVLSRPIIPFNLAELVNTATIPEFNI
ncbi:hypothetical protein AcV5_003391 [Taiwanofungus camphoratus]|nr:hypothetical protein AcV5_003391 [Antrodia cinnamomea]KAI0935099.1 hypothetical protein AcV7_003999 [Antrodia cinnamomea]